MSYPKELPVVGVSGWDEVHAFELAGVSRQGWSGDAYAHIACSDPGCPNSETRAVIHVVPAARIRPLNRAARDLLAALRAEVELL